jgi:signal transduction histidine kinase
VNLARLRWLAIVAPVGFLAVFAVLLRETFHSTLHEFPGVLILIGVLAVGVAAFSFAIFGVIGRLERRLIQRNQELAAVLAVGQAAASSVELPEMLDKALAAILGMTPAETAELWLTTDEGELTLECQRGFGAEAPRGRNRLAPGEGLPGLAVQRGSAVVVHDPASDPRYLSREIAELGLQAFCALPLRHRGEIVGVLAVSARERDAFADRAELRLLEGIGEQIVVAIENARLLNRVLDRAVLEERERIARDLHDGLAQVLGYINTQALAIKKHLASDRPEEVRELVDSMGEAARHVYGDIREEIMGLRAARDGLVPSLQTYLSGYGRMTGVVPDVRITPAAASLRLTGATEIQLLRIIQEALSNVRKHAGLEKATVSLDLAGDTLRLEVADDGRGFDPDSPARTGWPRFGLQTMRERAGAVGGTFELCSSPGTGTSIVVHVPVAAREEVTYARAARG